MSRYSIVVVSMAILVSAGCAPDPSFDDVKNQWATTINTAVDQWSPNFDNAANRCAAIGAPSGSADCIEAMRRYLADEKRHAEKYCYTVADRVVCKKDPLHPFDAASAFEYSPRKPIGRR